MARVLVLTFSHLNSEVLDSFRQSFIDSLAEEGNDVLVMRSEDFIDSYHFVNRLGSNVDRGALDARIKEFDPELVFSFNHAGLYSGLSDLVECPIALWLVDGPAYLVETETYKRQAERYHTLIPSRAFWDDLVQGYGTPESRLTWVPFCSDFRRSEADQTQPVAFVGTYFHRVNLEETLTEQVSDPRAWDRIRKLVDSYRHDLDRPFADRLTEFRLEHVFDDDFDEAGILNTLSLNRRVQVLQAVADLGLRIYGNSHWLDAAPFSLELVFAFDPTEIKLKEDLETVYNASKLILNVSHAQARGGVPWRVFDAMATQAVLVSDFQQDLRELFPTLELPTYETPHDARQLAQRLLSDYDLRNDLAARSNAVIESGHRFKHRLAQIGDTVGVDLLPGGGGHVARLAKSDFAWKPATKVADPGDEESTDNKGAPWWFQVYYSDTEQFDERRSVRVEVATVVGESIDVAAQVVRAPRFLRVDPGDWFGIYEDVSVVVRPAGDVDDAGRSVDFGTAVRINQIRQIEQEEGLRTICGADPWVVFENPYPENDVEVGFSCRVIASV